MKTRITAALTLFLFLMCASVFAQQTNEHHINTIFSNHGSRASGGYAAFTNKFTMINGDYANMVEFYGGWYIDHRLLIGLGGGATTSYLKVPFEDSTAPTLSMSYEYVQAGLMTEYVIASDRAIHLAFQLFGGAAYTMQYQRNFRDEDYWNDFENADRDDDFFLVAEPGVKIEVNIFRWLRLCPGVSYRFAEGSKGRGLGDDAINSACINMTLKVGKF